MEGSAERVVMMLQIRSLAGLRCSLLSEATAGARLVQQAGDVQVVLHVATAGTSGQASRPPCAEDVTGMPAGEAEQGMGDEAAGMSRLRGIEEPGRVSTCL
ncbi:hypothetical protein ALMP_13060 [Streptomyces sp. A012304]|nr:hypothetical protein ALMP_13060 [Streptomyces sp. A012304]